MTFIVQVQVEAENGKAAANKIPDEAGTVVGITVAPQQFQNTVAKTFSTTSGVPHPQ